ncbi:BatD family protein [Luteimonas sp. RD2P54]|uniref:BatD family protein n=1 Tax=Luteimonas endophytica TaxID=3042023 RepID=A0ABT6J7T4_9GAMM|nr:BatD family protein [Luteimonas endophytica]MDH5822887.1 BatD family protein [Luteimonas endophytica]
MPKRPGFLVALLSLLLLAAPASAETRAWLDRDRIELGETATLNIETDQGAVGVPDWSPLDADFAVSGHTSSRRVESAGGGMRVRVLFAVALQPRREGLLTVPGLRVGGERTAPLTLTVAPASTAPARAGAAAFIEAEADSSEAYVQQAIGYVLRLYYATPLVSGQLLQPQPEGASLQRLGNDLQYSRDIDGRRYTVVERRFLLVPERSGTLTVPGAQFTGRGSGSFFDDVFGSGPRELRANGAPRFIEVRPVPDAAPRPWLPLRGLELRYLEAPRTARAGESATVVVELAADGATAAQLAEPELSTDGDAEVFAEPAETEEHFDRGRPQVRMTRRFSIVPAEPGTLLVQGARMQWWDARAGRQRSATLPDIEIEVAPGAASPPAAAGDRLGQGEPDPPPRERWIRVPGVQGEVHPWALLTVLFALLWLGTLAWGLQRRRPAATAPGAAVTGAQGGAGAPSQGARLRRLRTVLDTGDLGEIAEALCALAAPPAAGIDALRARLAAPAQLAAVDALERARWAGGEPAAARAAVRGAFADGPVWKPRAPAPAAPPLAPLYPERRGPDRRE